MWSANEVEKVARKLVDELQKQRPQTTSSFRKERWASDYEQNHCFDLLILHYESGDPYVSIHWKYHPIQEMDEAERCFFDDWAD